MRATLTTNTARLIGVPREALVEVEGLSGLVGAAGTATGVGAVGTATGMVAVGAATGAFTVGAAMGVVALGAATGADVMGAAASERPQAQVACKHTQCSPASPRGSQPQIAEYDPPDSHSEYSHPSSSGYPVGLIVVLHGTRPVEFSSNSMESTPMRLITGTFSGQTLPFLGPNSIAPLHCHFQGPSPSWVKSNPQRQFVLFSDVQPSPETATGPVKFSAK